MSACLAYIVLVASSQALPALKVALPDGRRSGGDEGLGSRLERAWRLQNMLK